MRLKVSSPAGNYTASSVPQRFAAFTDDKPVGTVNLANCMGIVIHNRLGHCGVVAHVEAGANSSKYAADIDYALRQMMSTLNTAGGSSGSLSIVILGNANGGTPDFNEAVEKSIWEHVGEGLAARLNKLDLMDARRIRT